MQLQQSADLPQYHEDMLLVKVRSAAGSLAATAGPDLDFRGAVEAPGLSALSVYERAGFIKRVVPLTRRAAARALESAGPATAMAGITAAAISVEEEPLPNAGAAIVELHSGTDARDLQLALASDASVEYVARVPVRYLTVPADDPGAAAVPSLADPMWNLKQIRWPQVRAAGMLSATGVRVAVLDTGLDVQHPDLPGARRYVHDYGIPGGTTSDRDIVGHGTHVTGTICALINNALGINGICECQPSVLKIFGDQVKYLSGLNYYAFLVDPVLYRAALADCLEEGEQVVNLSIGGYGAPDPQEAQLFKELVDNGCAVIAAMGNDNTHQPSYPAAINGVIAVGATGYSDERASFSNVGNHIALCAPGVGIWSTLPTYSGRTGNYAAISPSGLPVAGKPMVRETHYAAWQGTSMATPHVSAAAALLIAKYGATAANDIRHQLTSATDTVPGMMGSTFTPEYGAGRLNLMKL